MLEELGNFSQGSQTQREFMSRQPLPQRPRDRLTTHPAYSVWMSRDSGMLGLRGAPETGRFAAINHLFHESLSEGAKTRVILMFSFKYDAWHMDSAKIIMYSTLLHNLLSEYPQYRIELWNWMDEHRYTALPRHDSDYRELLLFVLKRAIKEIRVRIFLDGLDAIGDRAAREIIADFRYMTSDLLGIPEGLSICFTCRGYPAFSVDNGLEIDLEEVFETVVVPPPDIISRYEFYRDTLTRNASNFMDAHTRSRLKNLAITMMLLQFIHFSRKGLSLQELRSMLLLNKRFKGMPRYSPYWHSLKIEDDIAMMDLLTRYLGQLTQIVDIIDESGSIRSVVSFVDSSISSWLCQPNEMARVFEVAASDWVGLGHCMIALACYASVRECYDERGGLSIDAPDIQDLEARSGYAIDFWFDHAARADAEGMPQAYLRNLLVDEYGRSLLQTWASDYRRRNPDGHVLPPTPSLEDIAEIFGIPSLLKDRP